MKTYGGIENRTLCWTYWSPILSIWRVRLKQPRAEKRKIKHSFFLFFYKRLKVHKCASVCKHGWTQPAFLSIAAVRIIGGVSMDGENSDLPHSRGWLLFTSALHSVRLYFTVIARERTRTCLVPSQWRKTEPTLMWPKLSGEFCRAGTPSVSAPEQLCPLSESDRHLFPLEGTLVRKLLHWGP